MKIYALILFILFQSTALAQSIYISPSGNDSNACSKLLPCKTVGKAKAEVRALVSSGLSQNVFVNLMGGIYYIGSGIEFTAADSGTSKYMVTWRSNPGDRAVIDGGQRLTPASFSTYSGNILRTSVGPGVSARQFYSNGTHIQRARGALNPSGWARTETGYTAPDSSVSGYGNLTSVEIVSYAPTGWAMHRGKISSAVGTNITMETPFWTIQQPIWDGYRLSGTPSWVENAYELLSEGEWYLNPSTGYLYYWPQGGTISPSAELSIPLATSLATISGASNISFHDLTWRHSTWLEPDGNDGYAGVQAGDHWHGAIGIENVYPMDAAITVDGSSNIFFSHNDFIENGSYAIAIRGSSSGVSVTKNWFAENAGGGIQVGDGRSCPAERSSNIKISDNYFSDSNSFDYWDAIPINIVCSSGVVVSHNHLNGAKWAGISVGWVGDADTYTSDTMVTDNYIYGACSSMSDCGQIYTRDEQSLQNTLSNGLQIYRNHMRALSAVGIGCIYQDVYSSYTTFNNNVCQTANYGAWIPASSAHHVLYGTWYSSSSITYNTARDSSFARPLIISTSATQTGPSKTIICNAGISRNVYPGALTGGRAALFRDCTPDKPARRSNTWN